MRTDEYGKQVPSTLGEYWDAMTELGRALGIPYSKNRAVTVLNNLIDQSPNRRKEIVTMSDSYMRSVLFPLLVGSMPDRGLAKMVKGLFKRLGFLKDDDSHGGFQNA